jgi:stage II sporulation protein D
LVTINILNIEDYLKGVVPGEMPNVWPLEALKAQALAARSYAVRNINPAAIFDMDDTTLYQIYLGARYEFPSTNTAVEQTKGEVVTWTGEIISTYYHSTSGGYTENNENVWGGSPRPYLRGVPSPWEENSPWWSWTSRTFSRQELSSILAKDDRTKVGLVKSLEITNRGVSGRVIAIKITGTEREVIVTGQVFRRVINENISITDPPVRSILFGIKS